MKTDSEQTLTVAQLMDKLSRLDPSLPVLGYWDITFFECRDAFQYGGVVVLDVSGHADGETLNTLNDYHTPEKVTAWFSQQPSNGS